jgi:hypothetical protein
MTYAVLVRYDGAGAWPVIVSADDKLFCSDGTCWRFVAAVETFQEAVRLHGLLLARRERDELLRAPVAPEPEG